jgi:hypothetical protein
MSVIENQQATCWEVMSICLVVAGECTSLAQGSLLHPPLQLEQYYLSGAPGAAGQCGRETMQASRYVVHTNWSYIPRPLC